MTKNAAALPILVPRANISGRAVMRSDGTSTIEIGRGIGSNATGISDCAVS
jgi:hypothetical protein